MVIFCIIDEKATYWSAGAPFSFPSDLAGVSMHHVNGTKYLHYFLSWIFFFFLVPTIQSHPPTLTRTSQESLPPSSHPSPLVFFLFFFFLLISLVFVSWQKANPVT